MNAANAASTPWLSAQPARGSRCRAWMSAVAIVVAGIASEAVAAQVPDTVNASDAPAKTYPVDMPNAGTATAPVERAATSVSPLERRVVLLARELDLDPAQQAKVRALLETQRAQVARVWQDTSVPGALRIQRTQLVTERTEEGIRALLTEDQKAKYVKPRNAGGATGGSTADLATWMDKVNAR